MWMGKIPIKKTGYRRTKDRVRVGCSRQSRRVQSMGAVARLSHREELPLKQEAGKERGGRWEVKGIQFSCEAEGEIHPLGA